MAHTNLTITPRITGALYLRIDGQDDYIELGTVEFEPNIEVTLGTPGGGGIGYRRIGDNPQA